MRYYRFPENKGTKAAFGIFLFVMLCLARDTLVTSIVLGFQKSQFWMLGLICAAGAVFLWANRRNLKALVLDERMAVLLAATAVLLLPMVCKRDWQLMYFSILLCVYFAVFLSYFVTFREAARWFVWILAALAVYSLLALYGLRPLTDLGILSPPVVVNSTKREFYNYGLSFVSIVEVKNRNFGLFREPGVYQFFLIVGLYLNNYTLVWKKKWQLWLVNGIFAVTMLSTFATGGVIEMGLFAVVVFFDKKWYKDKWARRIAAAVVAAAVAVVVISKLQKNALYYELYGMIVAKFVNRTVSVAERTDAIFTDLRFFLYHPLFGEKLATVLHAVANNTSSTLILYAVFGAVGGTLNVAAWVALVWEKERRLWANLALLVILFMSFNTENLTWDIFFWLFPCMALVERGLPLLAKERT